MPPPRQKPTDTTERPQVRRLDDDPSQAKTQERPELRPEAALDDTSPSHAAARREQLPDTTVTGYKLEAAIGRGASGIVYRARNIAKGTRAAFKVLKPEFAAEPEYIRRLIEEARALAAIKHKGIIDILDFGALPNGQPYLVMELCDGLSLEEQLKFGGRPTLNEALAWLEELLDALDAAHERGVIHRDLKPSNLFLATYADGSRVLKVLDFGLARRNETRGSIRPTMPGVMVGTPDYMPPEQIDGRKMGPFSDVYALGGIAFRLMTGRLPFVAPNGIAVITKKMQEPPPHPSDVDPKIPLELDVLVVQMLAQEPKDRPSVREVRDRIAAYRSSLRRGPTPSLMDEEDASSKPTAFHQFNDVGKAQQVIATVKIPVADPAGLTPNDGNLALETQKVRVEVKTPVIARAAPTEQNRVPLRPPEDLPARSTDPELIAQTDARPADALDNRGQRFLAATGIFLVVAAILGVGVWYAFLR